MEPTSTGLMSESESRVKMMNRLLCVLAFLLRALGYLLGTAAYLACLTVVCLLLYYLSRTYGVEEVLKIIFYALLSVVGLTCFLFLFCWAFDHRCQKSDK